MLEVAFVVITLIVGLVVLIVSSDKAVEHSISAASILGISPLMIGLLIVSIGTDLPEIANSIIASAAGHGDINVGDSFGSTLTQISLVLGLLPILTGVIKVEREEILMMGACEILALIAAVSMVEKGYITRMNAIFLVTSWVILMLIIRKVMKKSPPVVVSDRRLTFHLAIMVIGFSGVALGSVVLINSVVSLSRLLNIHEYLISFFIVAIGTSLPELFVDLAAIRKKQYDIAIGDIIGSCIVDAGLSIGLGSLFFPITVSGRIAETTGLYALFVSIIVIAVLALRKKADRKAGALFIGLYMLSYLTLLGM